MADLPNQSLTAPCDPLVSFRCCSAPYVPKAVPQPEMPKLVFTSEAEQVGGRTIEYNGRERSSTPFPCGMQLACCWSDSARLSLPP